MENTPKVVEKRTFLSSEEIKRTQEELLRKISNERDDELRQTMIDIILKSPIMEILQNIEALINNQLQVTKFTYKIPHCFITDGAYAIFRAVNDTKGVASLGNNGPSPKAPETIEVKFNDGTSIHVPWGKINIPGMSGAFFNMSYNTNTMTLTISGECQRRFEHLMTDLVNRARNYILTDSIYRGHAIQLDENLHTPTFLDLEEISSMELILNPNTAVEVETLAAKLAAPERCSQLGISLRDSVLFEGPFGTGKTLKALQLGYLATQNNWTFIHLKDTSKFDDFMKIVVSLAKGGAPVCFLVEDIDLIFPAYGNAEVKNRLNLLDDAEIKGKPVISIFTTNFWETVEKGITRSGRVNTITHFGYLTPEKNTVLLKSVLAGVLDVDFDFTKISELLNKYHAAPSFITETLVNKVKTYALLTETEVNEETVIGLIESNKAQLDYVNSEDRELTKAELFHAAFKDLNAELNEDIDEIKDGISYIVSNT